MYSYYLYMHVFANSPLVCGKSKIEMSSVFFFVESDINRYLCLYILHAYTCVYVFNAYVYLYACVLQ